jgi:hypothetical protein
MDHLGNHENKMVWSSIDSGAGITWVSEPAKGVNVDTCADKKSLIERGLRPKLIANVDRDMRVHGYV